MATKKKQAKKTSAKTKPSVMAEMAPVPALDRLPSPVDALGTVDALVLARANEMLRDQIHFEFSSPLDVRAAYVASMFTAARLSIELGIESSAVMEQIEAMIASEKPEPSTPTPEPN